ncbi:MAG TPA: universal stress protein [Terracidiphilus sp.]|nr:universal stress protein [Terracidiphilus sp.]
MQELEARTKPHAPVILVATDLNDLDRLMPFALREAAECNGRLILLHVLPASRGMAIDPAGMPYYDPTSALESAGVALEPWCRTARKRNIACDALVREGQAAEQISTSSRQFLADRILLGTRSRSKLSKLLIGSVAEQVLRSVNLPVITVGPEAHLPVQSNTRERVVVLATSFGETSRPSAALACRIAASQHAKLVLLHVLPPVIDKEHAAAGSELNSIALVQLRTLAEQIGHADEGGTVIIEPLVAHGNPAIEILATASELQASLIVLGSTQRSAFQNLTRDRIIYRVLAHARCPVLTLREPSPSASAEDVEQLAERF